MLVKILIAVAGVIALFAIFAATRPAAYHVERKLDIAAPPDRVFGVLNDLHQFAGVWVLFKEPLAADVHKTFAGPAAGVGQSFAWEGKDAGKGSLTIAESVPGQKVGMQLELVEPMASKATYALTIAATAGGGSAVTWTMDGNHNFLGKAAGVFMNMDRALGTDLELALARVKSAAGG